MGSVKNLFKDLDIFAITFGFRIGNREKYSSVCGGSGFAFFIFLAMLYILKSLFDYISFSDIKFSYIEKFDDLSEIILSNETFFYSFKFTYLERKSPSDKEEKNVIGSEYEKYFSIQRDYSEKIPRPENKALREDIRIRNCSHVNVRHFQNLNNISSNYLNLSDHICFNYPNMTIFGQYTDDEMSDVEVTLKINSTFYHQNKTQLKDMFNSVVFKFAFYHSDKAYDISKLEDPIKNRVESKVYTLLDGKGYQKVNIFLQEIIFNQDHNLLFKNPKNSSFLILSESDKIRVPIENRFSSKVDFKDKYNLVKFFIRPDMKKTVVSVSLIKIPEFLSGISAIVTNMLIIFKLLFSHFNDLNAKQKIMRKIMKFNDVIKETNRCEINYFINKKYSNSSNIYNNSNNLSRQNDNYIRNNTNSIVNQNNSYNIDDYLQYKKKQDNTNADNLIDEKYVNLQSKIKNNNNQENFGMYISRKKSKYQIYDLNGNINNNKIQQDISSRRLSDDNSFIINQSIAMTKNQNNNNNSINEVDKNLNNNKVNCTPISFKINKNTNTRNINKLISIPNEEIKIKEIDKCKSSKKKENVLQITTCELILNYFFCKNIKNKKLIFKQAEKNFKFNMDIMNYLKKMFEIDILKYLLLDQNSLEIVNFISRPGISMANKSGVENEEIHAFLSSYYPKKHQSLNMIKIKNAFEKISETGYKKAIDINKRIMELFEYEIEKLRK